MRAESCVSRVGNGPHLDLTAAADDAALTELGSPGGGPLITVPDHRFAMEVQAL